MKKILIVSLVLVIVFGAVVYFNSNTVEAKTMKGKVENFSLKNYDGKTFTLTDYKDTKAIVIMFIATQCPISNDYNTRMAKIADEYSQKGVVFLGINSNKKEDVDEIAEHAKENKFSFPVLKDVNNIIADKYDAQVTPEIYVVNGSLELLYHGRIDDSRKEADVKTHNLINALDEILEGKEVSVKQTKAFGCTIKRI